ncbi:hypothetical protein H310_10859 [Aphanomyces invadans]|uniref:Uncharacterized protein n=1 Tax=Aphanomyces invadans TaxID=157072 RepID=A0A024TNU4_9STRA|nr:hypothetical protein H310_10859 [Aphanomyces invadans]ETV95810.1 hypothetical protein H310_10859 [Aphanomyces invadans]|eukprot:XP_008875561.1 hypothetical protein H310_10859 [Aphanomyces invadans]
MSMMYRQPQAAQTAYAAQAAKWRNNAESPWKTGGTSSSASNSVSELVLISELCSSIGQTSFPPKDAMTTLMRHIQALDHTYLCELLETKLEDSLWQVVARALAVLDALLSTAAATTYLDYFSSRKNLLQHLTDHAKQTVKSRAEKVFHALDAHVPTQASHDESSDDDDDYRGDHPSIYQRSAQQQRAPSSSTNRAPSRQSSVSSEMSSRSSTTSSSMHVGPRSHDHFDQGYHHGRPTGQSLYSPPVPASPTNRHTPSRNYQPPMQDLLLGSPIHEHESAPPSLFASLTVVGAPQPSNRPTPSSAFSFVSGSPPSRPQSAASSTSYPTPAAQMPPPSSTGFLTPPPSSPSNTSQSSRTSAFTLPEPSPTPSSSSAFSFVQDGPPPTTAFSFLQQTCPPSNHDRPQPFASYSPQPAAQSPFHENPSSHAGPTSAFSFLSAASQSPKRTAADRIHDAFADLSVGHDDAADDDAGADPFGSTLGDTSSSRGDMSEQDTDGRSEVSEDVHHVQHDRALRAAATMSTRDEFEALKKAGMAREVILEVDVPPGPMGIVLDRTTPESAILAEFVPLPSGDKGLIELHPAICPGCLLVAINGNSIEHVALPELGPVLANAAMYHRVLTFKKFMVGSRVMHPLKLKTPYTCPAPSLFDQVSSPRLTATRASWSSSPPSGPRPTPVHQSQPFEHVPATFAAAQRAFTTASSTNSSVFRFMQQQQAAVVASPRHDPPTTSAFGFMAATQPPPSRPFSPAQHPRQPPSSPSAFSFI